VAVGFAYAKVTNPDVRIIPVVLGIANFILGPMLGVFLLGMFTRRRGSDLGNMIAITAGLITTVLLGGLHVDLANLTMSVIGSEARFTRPLGFPQIAFTWFALLGATVVVMVGLFFRTPEKTLEAARRRMSEAATGDDRPISLRGDVSAEGAFPVGQRKNSV